MALAPPAFTFLPPLLLFAEFFDAGVVDNGDPPFFLSVGLPFAGEVEFLEPDFGGGRGSSSSLSLLLLDELDDDEEDELLSTLSDQPVLLESSSDSSDSSLVPEYSKLGDDGDLGMVTTGNSIARRGNAHHSLECHVQAGDAKEEKGTRLLQLLLAG